MVSQASIEGTRIPYRSSGDWVFSQTTHPSGQSPAAAFVAERKTKHPTAKSKRDMSMIEVIGPILCPSSAPGKIDIETDGAQSGRVAQLIASVAAASGELIMQRRLTL